MRLVVVLIPMKFRVFGEVLEFGSASRVSKNWDFPESDTLATQLKELCGELAITFVDSTDSLKLQAKNGKLVYPPFDVHLSSLGHKVVADLVVDALRAEIP